MDAREALARSPIFSVLEEGSLDALARAATVRRFAPGELLVKEGAEAVAFYVVCEGQAEAVKGLGQEGERVVGTLNPGDFFGEMALLDGFPRVASVRAAARIRPRGTNAVIEVTGSPMKFVIVSVGGALCCL